MTQSPQAIKRGSARLWQLAFTHRILVSFACLLAILSAIFATLPFIAIYFIIKAILTYLNTGIAMDSAQLIGYGWFACGSAIAAVLLNFAALACSHFAAFKTLYQLKLDFIKHLSLLPLGFYSHHSTGELRKVVDENIEKIELFIAHQLPDLMGSFAMPIILFFVLIFFDWRLGLATLFPVILAYIILFKSYGQKGATKHFENYHRQQELMNNVSVEYVRGISIIKAFNLTFFSFKKFYDIVKTYRDYCLKITHSFETSMGLFLLLLNNIYLFLIPLAIMLSFHIDNYFDFALSTIFYLVFSVSITGPFLKLMYVSNQLRLVSTGIDHLDDILLTKLLPVPQNPQTVQNYTIHFDHVSFTYQQKLPLAPLAIDDVTFTAKQGTITALVGASGSGKSTIANLIPRFFDVDSGSIKIGDIDIRNMDNEYLQSLVSFVFQDVFLFKQTILDNLKIGNNHATMEQIIDAAKAIQCHDFIESLPNGYNTVVGSNGIHLSGGERQRLIFARAIIKNAPILILDEATAFADPENEHKIQQAMIALMKGRTTIIIAHRLSSIIHADHILVLDQGKIRESGQHQTLLAQHGYYKNMWQSYTQTLNWQIVSTKSED